MSQQQKLHWRTSCHFFPLSLILFQQRCYHVRLYRHVILSYFFPVNYSITIMRIIYVERGKHFKEQATSTRAQLFRPIFALMNTDSAWNSLLSPTKISVLQCNSFKPSVRSCLLQIEDRRHYT